jgi:YidC/Oxa1 family membrane protein insertase
MKLSLAVLFIVGAEAFSPASFGSRVGSRVGTARSFGVDPSSFHDLPSHVDTLKSAFSTMSLADAADAVSAVPFPADGEAVGEAVVAASGNGWFGFLEAPIEGLLQSCHSALVGVGMSQNSWGLSILLMTTLIKLLTFPLTKTQLESTNKMQVSDGHLQCRCVL